MRGSPPGVPSILLAMLVATATAASANAESASIEASVRVIPLEITLELSALEARVGDAVRARATVTNAGPVRVSNVTVELRLDPSALSVKGSLSTVITRLQPGNATSITWTLCPTRAANNLLLARASVGGASVESQTRLLIVTGQRKRGC
jgi:uncharacterized repeat protein (TIGR01451 family)